MDRAHHPRSLDRSSSDPGAARSEDARAGGGARPRRARAPVPGQGRQRDLRRRPLRLPPPRRARDRCALRPLRPRLAPPKPPLRAGELAERGAEPGDRWGEGAPGDRGVRPRAPLHVPAGVPPQGDALGGVDDPPRPRSRGGAGGEGRSAPPDAAGDRARGARSRDAAPRLPRARRRGHRRGDARLGAGAGGSRARRPLQTHSRSPPLQDVRALRRAGARRRAAKRRSRAREKWLRREGSTPRSTSASTSPATSLSAQSRSRCSSCSRRGRLAR